MSVPYRVLFSNDTTNILTCKSPYNERGCMGIDPQTGKQIFHACSFAPSKLEATAAATRMAGVATSAAVMAQIPLHPWVVVFDWQSGAAEALSTFRTVADLCEEFLWQGVDGSELLVKRIHRAPPVIDDERRVRLDTVTLGLELRCQVQHPCKKDSHV